jgi:hypothetical protein
MGLCKHLLLSLLLLCNYAIRAQVDKKEAEHKPHRHSLSLSIAHAHISQGIKDGDRTWVTEPSTMLDYNYLISEKWIAGLHSDLILQTFQVKRFSDNSIIERSNPLCLVAVIGYKPAEYLTIMIGGGAELEKEENFGVIRIGIESSIRISEKWDVPLSLTYDAKIEGYDTWSIGIGIARLF